MPNAMPSIPVLDTIAGLADTTDAWISDIWGVLHDGVRAFPSAWPACVRFREAGGTIVLVTNAPRAAAEVAAMLDRLGIPDEAYDAIVTSGDLSRTLVSDYRGQRLFHLGPERVAGVLDGLDVTLVDDSDADVVLCTGLFDDEREQPDDYRDRLARLAARHVPLICANPDLIVERGHRLVPCAGALAEIYRELGGPVRYAGKPHPEIYERAFGAIETARGTRPPRERVLAIGDGIRTDVAGAGGAGLRCVFVASALHVEKSAALDANAMSQLFAGHPHPPIAAMAALAW